MLLVLPNTTTELCNYFLPTVLPVLLGQEECLDNFLCLRMHVLHMFFFATPALRQSTGTTGTLQLNLTQRALRPTGDTWIK